MIVGWVGLRHLSEWLLVGTHIDVVERANQSPLGLARGLVGFGMTSFVSFSPPEPPGGSPDRAVAAAVDSFHFIFPTLSRTVAPLRISRKGEKPTW